MRFRVRDHDDKSLSIPDDLLDLVTTDRVGIVSSIRADGSIATYTMWIDWDGEHVLTSSPIGSSKGRNWRRNPQASVAVVDRDDAWRFVIIRGPVTEIRPDVGLEFIDRMSLRYVGAPYFRRHVEREIFVITPDSIRTGKGGWGRRR